MTWTQDRIAKLCLASFPGFGARTLRNLWLTHASPEHAWLSKPADLVKAGVSSKMVSSFCEWRKETDPQALMTALERERIYVVYPEDKTYPRGLKNSSNPPEILFVRGELKDIPSVSIVGTRRMTSYGRQCAKTLGRELARTGLGIVSGLALGIDGLIHQMVVEENGYTIAVLGTGVDDETIYPREHYPLAHDILEKGGAIISEFPPRTPSLKQNFPIRNRLIAGISLATLVIEATDKSGSLITAKLALEENREVLAVPGPIWNEQSKGTNQLLKLGAKVCTEALDVLQALAMDRPDLIMEARKRLPLDPEEERLLVLLAEPLHADLFASQGSLSASAAAGKLALFEMKGLVSHLGGQIWVRMGQS